MSPPSRTESSPYSPLLAKNQIQEKINLPELLNSLSSLSQKIVEADAIILQHHEINTNLHALIKKIDLLYSQAIEEKTSESEFNNSGRLIFS